MVDKLLIAGPVEFGPWNTRVVSVRNNFPLGNITLRKIAGTGFCNDCISEMGLNLMEEDEVNVNHVFSYITEGGFDSSMQGFFRKCIGIVPRSSPAVQ